MSNPYNYAMPQSSNLNTINKDSLPIWAWVLIAIGIIVFIILIIALIVYAVKGSTKTKNAVVLSKAQTMDPLATAAYV